MSEIDAVRRAELGVALGTAPDGCWDGEECCQASLAGALPLIEKWIAEARAAGAADVIVWPEGHGEAPALTSFREVPVTRIYRREDLEYAWEQGYQSAMLDVANDGQDTENPYR